MLYFYRYIGIIYYFETFITPLVIYTSEDLKWDALEGRHSKLSVISGP